MAADRYPAFWSSTSVLSLALQPVAGLFRGLAALRRAAYGAGLFPVHRLAVPVLVVGNLSVGGTGKTPLVIWLVERARAQGLRPGVILRGHGGSRIGPMAVTADSDPAEVGDEAVLIAQSTGAPVVIGQDRPAAGRHLLDAHPVELLISDDGLQHYALARDAEVVVIDAERGLGNGACLPAGPLREPPGRLATVDVVVGNGGAVDGGQGSFSLSPERLIALSPAGHPAPPASGESVHAVAGIGHPERFFATLEALGYKVERHSFGDHHLYTQADFAFVDDKAVIMTAKDAVKCRHLGLANAWCLPVRAVPDQTCAAALDGVLGRLTGAAERQGSDNA